MKTIPKFTDLIAKADRFVEDDSLELVKWQRERQRYYFKNGYVASVILWSDSMLEPYKGRLEGAYWLDRNQPKILDTVLIYDDKELREFLEMVENL